MARRIARAAAALALTAAAAGAQGPPEPDRRLARDLLRELVATNTTPAFGTTTAAERMAARFRAAGFPAADVQVVGPNAKNRNLVVRWRARAANGTASGGEPARRPVLLLGHLDVVEARREEWSMDPFALAERDGYLYGRGTLDMKGPDATLVAALLRLRREGFAPARDVVLALTAGEEDGVDNGVEWLLAHRRALIDAEYCLNGDSGGGELRGGERATLDVQAAEKVYLSFVLTVRNPGGHSSLPTKDNAIYRLAAGLDRLSRHDFPARLGDITRAYFARMAAVFPGGLGDDMRAVASAPAGAPPDSAAVARLADSPYYNALLRTTCVATRLDAGHADNALPQTARALVNCRLLPDEDTAAVRRTLARAVADTAIEVAPVGRAVPSPPSVPPPALLRTLEDVARSMWGALPVVPYMETGATDGFYLRNAGVPVYGVSGIFYDVDDVRAHGKDERIGAQAFDEGAEFMYRVVRAVAGAH